MTKYRIVPLVGTKDVWYIQERGRTFTWIPCGWETIRYQDGKVSLFSLTDAKHYIDGQLEYEEKMKESKREIIYYPQKSCFSSVSTRP
jgi:hypothetical protein